MNLDPNAILQELQNQGKPITTEVTLQPNTAELDAAEEKAKEPIDKEVDFKEADESQKTPKIIIPESSGTPVTGVGAENLALMHSALKHMEPQEATDVSVRANVDFSQMDQLDEELQREEEGWLGDFFQRER